MQTQRQQKPRETPPDPIRSLVNTMRDDDILRIYRRVTMPDRLERLVEWHADTAGDSHSIREKHGCGKYVVRVMKRRNNGSLVIRSSTIIDISRWQAGPVS